MNKKLAGGWYIREVIGMSIVNPRSFKNYKCSPQLIIDKLGSEGTFLCLEQDPNEPIDLCHDDFDWSE